MEYISNFPIALVFLYLFIEALKAYLPYRASKTKVEEHSRDEVTDAVFALYDLSKKDLEDDKREIRELGKALKRANLEITFLERKLAAIMRAFDSILETNPESFKAYKKSVARYKKEMDEGIISTLEGEKDDKV